MEETYQKLLNPDKSFVDFLPGLIFVGIFAWLWLTAKAENENK